MTAASEAKLKQVKLKPGDTIGILGGGWLVSRAARRSTRAYGTIPAIATLILVPTLAAALLVEDWRLPLALMLAPMAACTVYIAPALALVSGPRSAAGSGSWPPRRCCRWD